MDFTLSAYKKLLYSIKQKNYKILSFAGWMCNTCSSSLVCIIRHDVDRLPKNSAIVSKIERNLNITSTFYFRIVKESYNPYIMEEIAKYGNEIGYHYEDVDLVCRNIKSKYGKKVLNNVELSDLSYESFIKNLAFLRNNFDIKSICMHGSPTSKYNNNIIWEKHTYKDLGIIGEPYYDINWKQFGYLTDTGRRWNGTKVCIRDKVNSKYKNNYKSTWQIINNWRKLPNYVMLTIHPQRWNDSPLLWTKELVTQNIKNVIKIILFSQRNSEDQYYCLK